MGQEKTNQLLQMAEQVINQSHYQSLEQRQIVPLDGDNRSIRMEDVLCLFRITKIVYDDTETELDKLSVVFNALHSCGASCILLLECIGGRTELYIGAVNKQRCGNIYYLSVLRDILKTSISGNLPGSELKEVVSRKEIRKVLDNALDNGFDSQCITAVSCVASLEDQDAATSCGLETLLGAVRDHNFTILVVADPVSEEQVQVVQRGYEDIGTNLSALETSTVTLQTGNNYTSSESVSTSISENLTRGIQYTQVHTVSGSYKLEKTEQVPEPSPFDDLGKDLLAAGVGALALMGTSGNVDAGVVAHDVARVMLEFTGDEEKPKDPPTDLAVKPEAVMSLEQSIDGTYSPAPEILQDSTGQQQGWNLGQQQGKAEQKGTGHSVTQIKSSSVQTSTQDLHIAQLSDKLRRYLQWLGRSKNYGMFHCCTYIISGSASTNLFVAGQYRALIQSYGQTEQAIGINTWTKENGVEQIRAYLLHLVHPAFQAPTESTLSTAMLLSSRELSRQMSLPRKSVVGVTVSSHASFGIEVVRKSNLSNGSLVRVGEVQHMGKPTGQPVLLDLQSLASHTFIAGTNGSGKSNTVFKILEELLRLNLPFLVIEPAKGEYKNIFGNDPNVAVYGTNPRKTQLLRLNPFWFNEDVSVHEHIDKLVEIFNASWSMTAAMPAVLKASIENAYKACGWNLRTSQCLGQRRFPTVKDVLGEFNRKMRSTAFSEEVKGNYVGALSMRMESLCNGIYGEIFLSGDLGDAALFQGNTLIDLSRVGSTETKAMLMGFLVVRLQEYRMQQEALNLPLQHITILEEAHHLLRKTPGLQTNEGTNLLGKSVEMIANMIAEMRSYGEGFLIVDQSPGLLDMSVMRNTNTKIIMRLLENSDRELVGNTIGLTQAQKMELSRLRTGECAIYQKEWVEPVLCMVDKAAHPAGLYRKPTQGHQLGEMDVETARGIAFEVITPMVEGKSTAPVDVQGALCTLEASEDNDRHLAQLLRAHSKEGTVRPKGVLEPYASILWKLVDGEGIWDYLFRLICDQDIPGLDGLLRQQLNQVVRCTTPTQTVLISLFLQKKGAVPQVHDFYYKWAWKYLLNAQPQYPGDQNMRRELHNDV